MNISSEELGKEIEYLKKTLDTIKSIIDDDTVGIQEKMDAINEMKRYIWNNSGVLDDVEISTSMYNVNADVNQTNDNIKQLQKLKKSLVNPYFGRIDFDNDDVIDSIYVGINGIMKDFQHYVFDWRSPIASLFYNYGVGFASYEAPIGKIEGNIVLKRQYKVNGETLERCFDSSLNIDDEYLQEILSNSSSDKMTNIVNSIQVEQNEIIRNLSDKFLIVQGIAGSGKTSVALHRIAYLLYAEKKLTSNNVLIFSPNEIFSEYISQVLPELGEDNVLQTTYSDFASSYIKGYKEIESFTSFVERFYKQQDIDQNQYKATKYKLSDEFKQLLDQKILEFKQTLSFKQGIKINNYEISMNDLNDLLKSRFQRIPLQERFNYIAEYICDCNNISYKKFGKTIKDKLMSLLNKNLNIKELYSSILQSEEFQRESGIQESIDFSKGKTLLFEDLIPLMYINFELNGYPNVKSIKHIIIDEAQDYTLTQLDMIKKIFGNASFTILGDINQTINPYYMYPSLENINALFNDKGRYIELSKTYRSSEEIINYTNDILGLNNICSIRKSSEIPVVIRDVKKEDAKKQLLEDINYMKEIGMKRIAVITKSDVETLDLYNGLKEQIDDIDIINETTHKPINNTVILPSYISKGLEFDGVIAYSEQGSEYQDKDKYLFYVVCTRAQHSLTVYNPPTLQLKKK